MLEPRAPDDRLVFRLRRHFRHNGQHFRRQDVLVARRVRQKALEAFDELIAAGEVTPALRQPFVVAADSGIDCIHGSLLCLDSKLETIRNMRTEFEEQLSLPGPCLELSSRTIKEAIAEHKALISHLHTSEHIGVNALLAPLAGTMLNLSTRHVF